jgi:XTP/dITP diphosphohydrolase
MMKEFLLATGNAHKAEEFRELFRDSLKINPAPATLEVAEPGKTFVENALLKAKAYFDVYQRPTMADDSGLVLEAFPNIMGVETANYASDLKDYKDRGQRVIDLYKETANRSAYFVCVLCFYLSKDEIYFFEGRVHGMIGEARRGDQGFGYDPIFIPERKENDGLSLAELPDWKSAHSHRAKAAQSAQTFFKDQ